MARWRERLRVFLFPPETDLWLGLLRIGLGLQVLFYTLSLRADWNYLFAGPGEGLIGRALPEALLSTESPLVPRLGWLVMLTTRTGFVRIDGSLHRLVGFAFRGRLPGDRNFLPRISNFGLVRSSLCG